MKKYSKYEFGTILKGPDGTWWFVDKFYFNDKDPGQSTYWLIRYNAGDEYSFCRIATALDLRTEFREITKAERILYERKDK